MDLSSAQTFQQDPARYREPRVCKEVFERIYALLKELGVNSVLDVGCANGDFLYFLPDHLQGTGIDISGEFIEIAKKRNQKPNLRFLALDILADDALKQFKEQYDAVTMIGVLSTFHDYRRLFDRILALKTKFVIIHSPLNDYPVDAAHFHRDLTRQDGDFQCAYNIFSKVTISEYLQGKGVTEHRFIPFEMKKTLVRNEQHPTFNFHIVLDNGERYLTNGIGIIFKEYILLIKK